MRFFGKKQYIANHQRLLGTWHLVRSDASIETGNGITMTFTSNGQLIYVIHQDLSDQIMNLVFDVSEDRIVTNQASSLRGEFTKFSFDNEGHLILDYGGSKCWFARA